MAESHGPVSLDNPVGSARIAPDHEITALRRCGTRRKLPIADDYPAAAIHDRALRAFSHHLVGTPAEHSALVDDAVDDVLAAVARGRPIALRGPSDLVPVAYALHRRILGAERPFIVCDPRRCESDGSVRVPPSRQTGLRAREAASGGSLCLHARRLPRDFDRLRDCLRHTVPGTTVFVCLYADDRIRDLIARPLEVPPLAARASESDDLLQVALDEAAAALGAARRDVPPRLRHGILERIRSFAELEKTALRLVAIASAPNLSQAAKQLRMAPVSLTHWLSRRPWLGEILRDLEAHRELTNT